MQTVNLHIILVGAVTVVEGGGATPEGSEIPLGSLPPKMELSNASHSDVKSREPFATYTRKKKNMFHTSTSIYNFSWSTKPIHTIIYKRLSFTV